MTMDILQSCCNHETIQQEGCFKYQLEEEANESNSTSSIEGSTDDENYENNDNTSNLEDEELIEEAPIQIRAPRLMNCRIRGANYLRLSIKNQKKIIRHFF